MLKKDYPGNINRLVFRGFLDLRVDLPGGNLRLKTLNENEYADIQFYGGFSYDELREIENEKERSIYFIRFLPWILAWSTLLVGDHNVLVDRSQHAWYLPLVDFYKKFNPRLLLALDGPLSALRAWYVYESPNAMRLAMDPLSRTAWPSYKNAQLNDPSITCFPGTGILGLNIHQVTYKGELNNWSHRTENENLWELAKFLGSFQDPKHIKKLASKDKIRREQEEKEEMRVLRGELEPGRSKEHIYQEMERDAIRQMQEGLEDDHDKMIKEHDRKMKIHAFKVGFLPHLFSIMYSRKIKRKEAVVLGRGKKETPSDKLPLGEYDVTEVRGKAEDFLANLDQSGFMAAKIGWSNEELDKVIYEMSLQAKKTWEERKEQYGQP